ncbi:uncharacterized protein LOC144135019 [Amblyomma americanum]
MDTIQSAVDLARCLPLGTLPEVYLVLLGLVSHGRFQLGVFAHLSLSTWLNVSIPVVEDGQGNRHHSRCAMYDLAIIVFNGSRIEVPRQGWVYDTPDDTHTLISKRLSCAFWTQRRRGGSSAGRVHPVEVQAAQLAF